MGSIVVINIPLSKLKDILLTYIEEMRQTERETHTHAQSQYTYKFIPMLKNGKEKEGLRVCGISGWRPF